MMPTGSKRVTYRTMLSVPHMIVIFVVVLVVFGPKKLPELARGLGKLMAEFRKASTDFRSAFEQEMRDLERQAMLAERKKQAEAAAKAASESPATEGMADTKSTENSIACPETASQSPSQEVAPVIAPLAEAVPRSSEGIFPGQAPHSPEPLERANGTSLGSSAPSTDLSDLEHDQRPA
jgi:sec-independent protein translocase protein TatB